MSSCKKSFKKCSSKILDRHRQEEEEKKLRARKEDV